MIEYFRKRPFLIHLFAYIVIGVSFFLLYQSQEATESRVVTIEQNTACVVAPKSRNCTQQIGAIVKEITPKQSLIILCKANRALGAPCIDQPKKDAGQNTKGKSQILGPGTQGTIPDGQIIPSNPGSASTDSPSGTTPNPGGSGSGDGAEPPRPTPNPPPPVDPPPNNPPPNTPNPNADCIVNALGVRICGGIRLGPTVEGLIPSEPRQ